MILTEFNIIGFSDVITNSSTEVFVYYDKSSIECFKKMVDSILKIANSDKTCDDLFDIDFIYDYGSIKYYYDKDLSNEELEEIAKQDNCVYHDDWGVNRPLVEGIKVIPKDENNKELANIINQNMIVYSNIDVTFN